jgi:hypothetical protein
VFLLHNTVPDHSKGIMTKMGTAALQKRTSGGTLQSSGIPPNSFSSGQPVGT